jgi:hypothetical protein
MIKTHLTERLGVMHPILCAHLATAPLAGALSD